jgi:hypothetical protein
MKYIYLDDSLIKAIDLTLEKKIQQLNIKMKRSEFPGGSRAGCVI